MAGWNPAHKINMETGRKLMGRPPFDPESGRMLELGPLRLSQADHDILMSFKDRKSYGIFRMGRGEKASELLELIRYAIHVTKGKKGPQKPPPPDPLSLEYWGLTEEDIKK